MSEPPTFPPTPPPPPPAPPPPGFEPPAPRPPGHARPPAPRPSGLDRLGPRVDRRPEPRLGTALAGAGVALVVLGALAVGGDHASSGGGTGSRLPGILLSLAVVVAGYLLSFRAR